MKYRNLLTVIVMISLALGVFSGFSTPRAIQASAVSSVEKYSLTSSQSGIYLVRLEDPSVSMYMGGISGYNATSREATGASHLDADSPDSQAYKGYLQGKQQELLGAMQTAYGRVVEVNNQYQYAMNAIAVYLSHAEALAAFDLPGVIGVYPDNIRYMDSDMGPALINADEIWDGNTTSTDGTYGEGVIIGVLDTGINYRHPSFADPCAEDGYDYTNPYHQPDPDPDYHGWCIEKYGFCNDKLIGAYNFIDPNVAPDDDHGHGSHTASTAAGNFIEASFLVNGQTQLRDISGVAPRANIVAYKVLNSAGSGSDSTILPAIESAISVDEVDVINYSISGSDAPWDDPIEIAFLNAYAAGIFVSASAGNNGPSAGTVAHTSPWVSSVAASTHSRLFANMLDVANVTEPVSIASRRGINLTTGAEVLITSDVAAGIKYDPTYHYGCNSTPIPVGTYSGLIGLVQRGNCPYLEKATNLKNAGAVAMVVYNNAGGPPISMGFSTDPPIPSVMISLNEGTELVSQLTGDLDAIAVIEANITLAFNVDDWEDVIVSFSSRGPSQYELLKPDYSAPGVNILAALNAISSEYEQYGLKDGTSMAAPHGAGAAALFVALDDLNEDVDWSPGEIRSMLSTTTDPLMTDYGGVNPANFYAMGSGRLDLSVAGYAALMMDETAANFEAADPSLGGEPNTLNLPYLVDYDCVYSCSWERSVSLAIQNLTTFTVSVNEPEGVDITVNPSTFELRSGDDPQELEITANITGAAPDATYFAEIIFDPNNGASTRMPVVIVSPPVIDVNPLSLDSTQVPDRLIDQSVTISNLAINDLEWKFYGIPDEWSDNFDSYPVGSINGLGGWKGWYNVPTAAGEVSDLVASSLPNSQAIAGDADSVREYAGYTAGQWTYTAWQYIPTDFTGQSYFILLNSYNDAGTNVAHSVQVTFDSGTGLVENEGPTPGSLPLILGQWVELRIEIDLENDTQEFYYNDTLLYASTWTGELGGGVLNIGAVDLFANGASVVYYDDMSITIAQTEYCEFPEDIPWLSIGTIDDPEGDEVYVTVGGASTPFTVTFDSTGVAPGTYSSNLCISNNDVANPLVMIPVTLNVVDKFSSILPFVWK